jgi:hypothetical protein
MEESALLRRARVGFEVMSLYHRKVIREEPARRGILPLP